MKSPEGVVSVKHGVVHGCPAYVARTRKLHPSYAKNGAPPPQLLCTHYPHELGKRSCGACFRTRPVVDPNHTFEGGCRFVDGGPEVGRRTKKQFCEHAGAGPCRNLAILTE